MLTIHVPIGEEYYDDALGEFVHPQSYVLTLEHSLVSLSNWESFWEKPFLSAKGLSTEETLWYIKAMILTPEIPPGVFERLTSQNLTDIQEYMAKKQTATWFAEEDKKTPQRKIITAEVIYHWMVAMNIPFECQHWHLNKLLTLIRVINEENKPQKKLTPREAAKRQREINAQNRARLGTKG